MNMVYLLTQDLCQNMHIAERNYTTSKAINKYKTFRVTWSHLQQSYTQTNQQ